MNAHGEVEVQPQPFLTLALHTADRFAACTNRFTPRERHNSEPTKMQIIVIMFNLGPKHI